MDADGGTSVLGKPRFQIAISGQVESACRKPESIHCTSGVLSIMLTNGGSAVRRAKTAASKQRHSAAQQSALSRDSSSTLETSFDYEC